MEKVTLYGIALSAFVAKVRIALDLKRVSYDEVPPPDGYGSAAYRAIVPAGSVPGLVHVGREETLRLSDSNAMIEYIDEVFDGPLLLPKRPSARAEHRVLMGFHDTRIEAAARGLFPQIKAGAARDPAAVDAGFAALHEALARLDAILAATTQAGARPGYAGSLGYPVTLQMAQMMATELGRSLSVPARVSDWAARTGALPPVARSLRIARDAMDVWMGGFRA